MFDELLISGAKIVDGRGILNEGVIVVRDGKIASVRQGNICSGTNCLDASGYIIVPGFVDLHLHGDTPDYLPDNPVMCAANEHVKGGTTSFLATFSTSSKGTIAKQACILRKPWKIFQKEQNLLESIWKVLFLIQKWQVLKEEILLRRLILSFLCFL